MKKIIVLILLVPVLASFGCASKNKREKLAPELAAEAMASFDKERYQNAIETFNQLRDWYPFDKLATLAEFKIAEAHFRMEEYEEAIAAYTEFEKLHPRNEAVPYVLHQIALCYYNRIDSVDRDQNNAKAAIAALDRLVRQFPDSPFARDAEEKRLACLKSIAGHEIYVGRFYYKSKYYKSAISRFKTVLSQYPGLGFDEEARELLEKSEQKLAALEKSGESVTRDIIIVPE
ncbi:hypothetical protein JCM14469_36550 [Desulfatiferula olefinivorans]